MPFATLPAAAPPAVGYVPPKRLLVPGGVLPVAKVLELAVVALLPPAAPPPPPKKLPVADD